jgi:hypothetical protein
VIPFRTALCLLAFARAASAQVPGTVLSAARNAHVREMTLPTVSFESGHYWHRTGHVTPLAVRGAIDRNGLTLSAGYGWLLAGENSARDGHGVGLGVAFDLWPSGKTSYLAFGGRLVSGLGLSHLRTREGSKYRRLDIPIALAFSHKLPPRTFTVLPWVAPRIQFRIVDDGTNSVLRWVAGGSLGLEVVKAGCDPGRSCIRGWGVRVGWEAVTDVEGGPVEWGITGGLIWKFF